MALPELGQKNGGVRFLKKQNGGAEKTAKEMRHVDNRKKVFFFFSLFSVFLFPIFFFISYSPFLFFWREKKKYEKSRRERRGFSSDFPL